MKLKDKFQYAELSREFDRITTIIIEKKHFLTDYQEMWVNEGLSPPEPFLPPTWLLETQDRIKYELTFYQNKSTRILQELETLKNKYPELEYGSGTR